MHKALAPTLLTACAALLAPVVGRAETPPAVGIAIVGLVHDHARGMIPRFAGRTDARLVGIVETNPELIARYQKEFHLPPGFFYPTLEALAAREKVQAVAAFTATSDHRSVVEACAGRGIDVMMEKPLATTLADAQAIAEAAEKGRIQVVVNYETTWYPSVQKAYELLNDQGSIGEPRKFVVHDGHEGPKAIGCSPYFLEWLTDPVRNGGGALMDFGCYGADLVTWMMQGRRPTSVVAVTQHLQPDAYPRVDDEATIVITYPRCQAVIQASWNWPYDRKDMEIYGEHGALMLPNRSTLTLRLGRAAPAAVPTPDIAGPNADPLSYLAAVARREIQPAGLSSLSVNLVACEILDAARRSSATGERVDFPPEPPHGKP